MTGISIKVELREEEARRHLQDLIDRMGNRKPFLMAIGERMLASTGDRFRTQTAPDGTPWAPHAAATIKNRTRKGQLPLTILRSNTRGQIGSSLAGSVNYAAAEDEVRIGSAKETAAIHQLGGAIQKPARAAKIWPS